MREEVIILQEALRLVVEVIVRVKSSPLRGSGEGGRARVRVDGRTMIEPGPLWQSSQHESFSSSGSGLDWRLPV